MRHYPALRLISTLIYIATIAYAIVGIVFVFFAMKQGATVALLALVGLVFTVLLGLAWAELITVSINISQDVSLIASGNNLKLKGILHDVHSASGAESQHRQSGGQRQLQVHEPVPPVIKISEEDIPDAEVCATCKYVFCKDTENEIYFCEKWQKSTGKDYSCIEYTPFNS